MECWLGWRQRNGSPPLRRLLHHRLLPSHCPHRKQQGDSNWKQGIETSPIFSLCFLCRKCGKGSPRDPHGRSNPMILATVRLPVVGAGNGPKAQDPRIEPPSTSTSGGKEPPAFTWTAAWPVAEDPMTRFVNT